MRKIFFTFFIMVSTFSFGQTNNDNNVKTFDQSQQYFAIVLPIGYWLEPMGDIKDNTIDYCYYYVKSNNNYAEIELNSFNQGRTHWYSAKDYYRDQLLKWSETVDITYSKLKSEWFVISGIGRNSGDVFYIKGFYGNHYVSTLSFRYKKENNNIFQSDLEILSKSFYGK